MKEGRLVLYIGLGWMFDALDVLILSYLLVAMSNELKLDSQAKNWIVLANNLGMLIGAMLFGRLADRVGRKKVFMSTLLTYSIATAISAFARNWQEFAVIRFFVGLGLGGELPVVATYVSENSPPERRGRNVVLLESFWSLGAILAAAISLFLFTTIGWRSSLLLMGATAFYVFVIRFTLPESQRWLELREQRGGLFETRIIGEFVRRLTLVGAVWFLLAFGYYGAFLWLPTMLVRERGFTQVGTYEFMFLTTLAQLPGYFSAAYLVEKAGRRPVGSLYFALSALSAAFFISSNSYAELLLWALALNFFNLGVWGVVYAYTPELFPTSVRGIATGLAGSAARIGMILGPLLYPLYASTALLIIAIAWLVASALILLLPETRGRVV
ncbi:MFS transporter [Pyrobaculum aerophilum]|uniref:MFS transporter n=1 Tax=Pyrobaculum aerophilum TaxID=13773 RepID=UPI00257E03F2|nr:MFS transporter [Pyrobaculum sp.]